MGKVFSVFAYVHVGHCWLRVQICAVFWVMVLWNDYFEWSIYWRIWGSCLLRWCHQICTEHSLPSNLKTLWVSKWLDQGVQFYRTLKQMPLRSDTVLGGGGAMVQATGIFGKVCIYFIYTIDKNITWTLHICHPSFLWSIFCFLSQSKEGGTFSWVGEQGWSSCFTTKWDWNRSRTTAACPLKNLQISRDLNERDQFDRVTPIILFTMKKMAPPPQRREQRETAVLCSFFPKVIG